MENEEKNNQELNNEENNQEVNQEELAKQWEEALQQQEEDKNQEPKTENEESISQEELAKQWEEALQQQNASAEEAQEVNQEEIAKQWEEALQEQKEKKESIPSELQLENEKIELLLDIPLEISVEIGQKVMSLEEVLKLNPNTILELNKYINEPVDIKINGKLVAKGELYTVENNFGIKITNIITVQERLKLLMEEGGE